MHHNKRGKLFGIIFAVLVTATIIVLVANHATHGSIWRYVVPMTMNNVVKEPHFNGTVAEVKEFTILVKVDEGEPARNSSDLIWVSLDVALKDSMTRFAVGDIVRVYYNGVIAESYPAQVNTVYAILLIDRNLS